MCERRRERRRLIFGCDLKQLFLCGALKMDPRSFPLPSRRSIYASSLPSSEGRENLSPGDRDRERKSI